MTLRLCALRGPANRGTSHASLLSWIPRLRLAALALLAALAACGNDALPIPETATIPPGQFGPEQEQDAAAETLAANAFIAASNTYGRPAEAARAAAALIYLAGEVATAPRWATIDPGTKAHLLAARQELRTALGAAPSATAQQLVDSLLAAASALAKNDRDAALQSLGTAVFPAGPEPTLAALSNLPYMMNANIGTQELANALLQPANGSF